MADEDYCSKVSDTTITTGLEPIIKWPGGKESELAHIVQNLPSHFDRFFDPFVGGGSVFMGINANQYIVNDLSSELIDFYKCIQTIDLKFFEYAESMNRSFENAGRFTSSNYKSLSDIYFQLKDDEIDKKELSKKISDFVSKNVQSTSSMIDLITADNQFFIKELSSTLVRKFQRMKDLELQKGEMPESDVFDNIETAIKGSLYMTFRHLYNNPNGLENQLKTALFFFIRNYAYSGMFRYNSAGKFNVPYGGIAYNRKLTRKKLNYYHSEQVQNIMSKTVFENVDFEDFLNIYQPTNNDFVFLDPPYDTEFSTYAKNAFTKDDQIRLANCLINNCQAKWMLVIKNTSFIYDLYANHTGINIKSFDKEYTVSFMNRNNKSVTHLLITNYV